MAPRVRVDHERVVQAAYTLVDAMGPEALTLTAIAASLGIRTPSLYNHIQSLHSLHRDLALRGNRELAAAMAVAVLGKARDEAVMAVAEAYRAFVREHRGIYDLMARSDPAGREPDQELAASEYEPVRVALAVLGGYGIEGADALHAVRGLRSVVHGFATLEAAGGFGLPLDVDESFRRLVGLLIGGLRGRQEEPPIARAAALAKGR